MPAHRTRQEPHVQLREDLARARAEGLSFDEAWRRTVGVPHRSRGTVRLPHQTDLRRMWWDILASTREEWRAAYEREPTAFSRLVDRLLEDDGEGAVPALTPATSMVRTGFVLPDPSIARPSRGREPQPLAVAA